MVVVSVNLSICHVAQLAHCAKAAEQIKILFGINILGGPRNTVFDEGPDPPQ